MDMEIQTISFIVGVILIVVGIFGGGIEIKEIKIPRVGRFARTMSSLIGMLFIVLGLWAGGVIVPEVLVTHDSGDNVDGNKIAITISSSLGRVGELREIQSNVRIFVQGRSVAELLLDENNPSQSASVELDMPGQYKYYFEGYTVWSDNPDNRVPLDGSGVIDVKDGDAFEMWSDSPPSVGMQNWSAYLAKKE